MKRCSCWMAARWKEIMRSRLLLHLAILSSRLDEPFCTPRRRLAGGSCLALVGFLCFCRMAISSWTFREGKVREAKSSIRVLGASYF